MTARTKRRIGDWTIRIVFATGLITLWQLTTAGQSRALAAPPSEIAQAFWDLTFKEDLVLPALATTARALFLGFAIAIVLGVGSGLLMGRSRLAEYVFEPWVNFLYAVPSIALIPVLVIAFGVNDVLRVVLVVLGAFFPITLNTVTGVKNVDQEFVDLGHSFCASRPRVAWTVVLPGALPLIMAGIRMGMSSAFVAIIGAEMLAVITGLGGMVITYANNFRMADMFVPIIVIVIIAVLISAVMSRLEHKIFQRWEVTDT